MKTKVLKIMVTFLLLVGLIMMGGYNVFAVRDPAEMIVPHSVDGDEELEGIGEEVLGIVTVIGYAMAIIISIIIGIKYMTGSVEEKAGYKKSMLPYIIGCAVLVAAPTITNVIYDASKDFKTSAVIKTKICNCGSIKEENCYHWEHGIYRNFRDVYYCTKCESNLGNATTCTKCGATYKGD